MEVFSALECELYRLGTVAGDTTAYSCHAYCEGISVSVSRELTPRKNDQGVVVQRVPVQTEAQMTIAKMYAADDYVFSDGNSLKLVMGNVTGTESWVLGSAYWQSKSLAAAGDGLVAYDVSLVGNSWGTTS
jgi:hypothetical protein